MVRVQGLKPAIAPLKARLAAPPKQVDPFYSTPEWRALAAEMKRQRHYTCEDCGAREGEPSRVSGLPVRLAADHVREIRDGGARLDPLNIKVLCEACHARKTAQARSRRLGL